MLLGISSDQERRNVHDLLSDSDVSLSDQHTGVVDRFGQVQFEDLGLESSLHEDLSGQLKDVIQGVLVLSHDTETLQAADQRRSLEQTLRILGVKSQQSTGSLQKPSKINFCGIVDNEPSVPF